MAFLFNFDVGDSRADLEALVAKARAGQIAAVFPLMDPLSAGGARLLGDETRVFLDEISAERVAIVGARKSLDSNGGELTRAVFKFFPEVRTKKAFRPCVVAYSPRGPDLWLFNKVRENDPDHVEHLVTGIVHALQAERPSAPMVLLKARFGLEAVFHRRGKAVREALGLLFDASGHAES